MIIIKNDKEGISIKEKPNDNKKIEIRDINFRIYSNY